jgi:uncharacterized protein (DUF1800 family)
MASILARTALLIFLGISLARGEDALPPDQQQIVHVLNRMTFGPRPGDVEAVRRMGLRAYIDQQLHPETIDDSAVETELQQFELLQMSPQELETVFLEDTKRFLKKQKEQQQAAAPMAETGAAAPMTESSAGAPLAETVAGSTTENPSGGGAVMEPSPTGGGLIERINAWKSVAAIGQLEKAKLIRAVESPRQLQEVLVDFWTNHFNIDVKKGLCRVLKVADDRDVIRPHILGRFRDLLEASAKSPAMLFYLDNAENSVTRVLTPFQQEMLKLYLQRTMGDLAQAMPAPGKKMGGINENYAREIMELHTLGVDGGYTQKDVDEVARCFTGWTLNRKTGEFVFTPRRHDNGEKFVLGHEIPANGGMQDGETVLDILASAPATAHHISLELCQRFISDDPPEALVTRIASVFQQTDGDLRQVTAAILTSPEFLSPSSYQTKIKSPLEFAVSAVRATESALVPSDPPPYDKIRPTLEGAGVMGRGKAADRLSTAKRQSLNWHIYELGEPLFACTPPTGYKEISKIWVSPGALIERLNFALALTQQQVADVRFDTKNVLAQTDLDRPDAVLDQCVSALLQGNISPSTRHVLDQAALPPPGESKTVDPSKLIALILGSPEFQRK